MNTGDVITFIDRERIRQGLSQQQLSEKAGYVDGGQMYRRMYAARDAKTSVQEKFLHALGYDMAIIKREETDEK